MSAIPKEIKKEIGHTPHGVWMGSMDSVPDVVSTINERGISDFHQISRDGGCFWNILRDIR